MKPCFLLDENLTKDIMFELRRKLPYVEITAIGEPGVPPRATPDPVILMWIEQHNYILVTNNRASMPVHIAAHFAKGKHFPGILIITAMNIGRVLKTLELIWEAAEAEEYFDSIEYIPF